MFIDGLVFIVTNHNSCSSQSRFWLKYFHWQLRIPDSLALYLESILFTVYVYHYNNSKNGVQLGWFRWVSREANWGGVGSKLASNTKSANAWTTPSSRARKEEQMHIKCCRDFVSRSCSDYGCIHVDDLDESSSDTGSWCFQGSWINTNTVPNNKTFHVSIFLSNSWKLWTTI